MTFYRCVKVVDGVADFIYTSEAELMHTGRTGVNRILIDKLIIGLCNDEPLHYRVIVRSSNGRESRGELLNQYDNDYCKPWQIYGAFRRYLTWTKIHSIMPQYDNNIYMWRSLLDTLMTHLRYPWIFRGMTH